MALLFHYVHPAKNKLAIESVKRSSVEVFMAWKQLLRIRPTAAAHVRLLGGEYDCPLCKQYDPDREPVQ